MTTRPLQHALDDSGLPRSAAEPEQQGQETPRPLTTFKRPDVRRQVATFRRR